MRNLSSFRLLLIGSSAIGAFAFVLLLMIHFFVSSIEIHVLIWGTIAIALMTFITFYFLIKRFIADRIRVLYRSIRKGKITSRERLQMNMTNDPIGDAEIETKKWADERFQEISKLKEQEEFRREFLGNLAHELKTPVFSIQGYILTLLEGGLEDQSINRMFLQRASKATDRMTMILEDLDQIAKFEVNSIQLDHSIFDIRVLVQDIFDDLEMTAKKNNITLEFARKFDTVQVYADRSKINQVLTNLINNSISYGRDGGTTSVRFFIMDGIVTIEVSDDGSGISEEDLPRIFERFYRVEKSRNRHEGGSGLGLSIVKHIIEAHQQTISVRSTIDIGSTFTFSLPHSKKER